MREEIIPLTSLRGVAALAVIAMHYSATMQQISSHRFPSLAPRGYLAVDVFFVLSGFIMGYTYLESFHLQSTWTAYCKFLAKRATRILPLNAAITIVLLAVAIVSSLFGIQSVRTVRPNHLADDLVTNALLLPGLGIGHSLNWPAWSISVEFAAYFAFPLFLSIVFHPSKLVLAVTCAFAFIGLLGTSLTDILGPGNMHNHPPPWRDLARCMSEFVLGLVVFRVYYSGKWASLFARDSIAIAIGVAILAVIISRANDIFAMLLFPPLILALSLNSGYVAYLLSMRFMRFLGVISFSIYLVTDPFRWPLQRIVLTLHPALISPQLAMVLATLFSALMIIPAWITFTVIEKPCRSILRSFVWAPR